MDGVANPFFANRPVYSASERPLMDSSDYNRLLQGTGDTYLPWQSVDRDNNNTNEQITRVRVDLAIQWSAIFLCSTVPSKIKGKTVTTYGISIAVGPLKS